ncbi:MAG: ABC transporter [Bacteroidetes bacterium]|nr:MAG: ABC transporter [Bacteroidota bacterium]
MRTIGYIIRKEFLQLWRNTVFIALLTIIPLVQFLVLVPAATLEMKKITYFVVDHDLSITSRDLCTHFEASPFYHYGGSSFDVEEGNAQLMRDESDMVIVIPEGFEKNLLKEKQASVQLLINAINGVKAELIYGYTLKVVAAYNREVVLSYASPAQQEAMSQRASIGIDHSYWYNPELRYPIYMFPGILVILISIIGMYISALNIVREKEIGTFEQINVTPIKRHQFIIGKVVPFWIIAMVEMAIGLVVGYLVFGVVVQGSLLVLFSYTAVYLLLVIGIGVFMSTISSTQQQVMFLTFFFMLTFILMSGIFTPVENMPEWAKQVNVVNPFAYFMRVIRMVFLKGSGFHDMYKEFFYTALYAIVMLFLSILRYRKVT